MKNHHLFIILPLLLLTILSGCSLQTSNLGSLSVSSKPGMADIYINGKLKGNTPKKKGVHKMPNGKWMVGKTHPKPKKKPKKKKVRVTKTKTRRY